MAEPFIGEIKIVAFDFAPRGWALCNGQTLSIAQNQALFSILGTTYGGNGISTFLLPNFQGRFPLHYGGGYALGQTGGESGHVVSVSELPSHTHSLIASNDTTAANLTVNPANAFPATTANPGYASTGNVQMALQTVATAGNNQPHENKPPYLVVNYVIALVGIFPSRN